MLPDNAHPYGIRDIKLTPRNADGTYGTMVDLPASRQLTWSDTEDFEQMRGDDVVQAERGAGPVVDWDLEQGGISLEAYAVIAGGAVVSSGVTPNLKKQYLKLGTDQRPYFRIDGQSINDNGGDTHLAIFKAKATGDIGGEFSDASFTLTSASGTGYTDIENGDELYEIVQNETAAAIVQPS